MQSRLVSLLGAHLNVVILGLVTQVAISEHRRDDVASGEAGLHFMCSQETGALLLLKYPGHKTYLDCGRHIARYMREHLASWYDFAAGHLGIEVEESRAGRFCAVD